MLRWLGYLWPWPLTLNFDPWIFKVKLYLRNGRPNCHGTKGTGVDRILWCYTLRKWVSWILHWLWYFWLWPLTLNFQGQIVSGEWEARLSWEERMEVDRMPWCERQPLCDLEAEDTVRDWGDLRCRHFHHLFSAKPMPEPLLQYC